MAESASNIHQGIFGKRLAFRYPIHEVSVDYLNVNVGCTDTFTFYPKISTFHKAVDESPLSQRCWTLQERILSARSVHFTDQGVFWSCPQFTASEQQTEGSWADNVSSEDPQWSSLLPCHRWNLEINKRQPREVWYYICEQYSQRRITEMLDKLPALSGVATLFSDQFYQDGKYLAGIWSADLPQALAWSSHIRSDDLDAPDYGRIPALPSWSWASLQTATDQPKHSSCTAPHMRAKVIEASTEKSGIDEFGHVLRGRLLLTGRFTCLSVRHDNLSKGHWTSSIKQGKEGVFADFDTVADIPKILRTGPDEEFEFPAFLVYKAGESTSYVLLLRHTGSSNPVEFRRIGLYRRFSHQRDEERFAEDWEERQIELI